MDILQKLKNNQRRIGLTGGIASSDSKVDAVVAVCAILIITAIIVFWVSTQ